MIASTSSCAAAASRSGVRRFSVANPLDFRDKATLNLASGLRTLGQFIAAGDTPKVRMPRGTRMHALVPSSSARMTSRSPWLWSVTDPELAGRPGWSNASGETTSRRQAMARLVERWQELRRVE
jgi:hypothetical protein